VQDGASTKPPPRRQGSATRQAHLQPSKPTCVRSQTIHSQRSRFTNSCSQGRAGQGRERKGGPTVERRSAGVAVGSQRQVSGPPAVGSRRAGHPQLSRALPARGHLQAHATQHEVPPPLARTWLWSMFGAAPKSSPEERLPAPRYSEWSPTIARSSQLMRPPNWFHTPPCPWCCAQRWLSTASPSTLMPWLCSVLTHLQGGGAGRGAGCAQHRTAAEHRRQAPKLPDVTTLLHPAGAPATVAKAAACWPLT